jgi:hypothetical protein
LGQGVVGPCSPGPVLCVVVARAGIHASPCGIDLQHFACIFGRLASSFM